MAEKCGDRNMHWYQDGDACVCGQVPSDIFFAASCDCGEYQMRHPMHNPECAYVAWAKKRNEWIANHPEVEPRLNSSSPVVDRFWHKRRAEQK